MPRDDRPAGAPGALPVPLNIRVPAAHWPKGFGQDAAADLAALAEDTQGSVGAWLLRTSAELRLAGLPVGLSPATRAGAINLVEPLTFGRRDRLNDHFVLLARGDGHASALANFVVHQNGLIPPSAVSGNIALWPQAGILPRDPARGDRVERLTYKGVPWNLDAAFRSEAARAALAAAGFALDLPEGDLKEQERSWRDYRNADAVLAVRNLTQADAASKPASKLVNAWIAGVPALLGPEPAYRELRQGPLDYIEVRSLDEVIAALVRLRDDPGLYRAMVENGRRRAAAFAPERLRERWLALLAGPVAQAFRRWDAMPRALRLARVAAMLIAEPGRKRAHRRAVLHGPRLLDPA